MTSLTRALVVIAAAALAACAAPAPKPPPAPVAEPKTGVVALVREVKERAVTSQNWTDVLGALFTDKTDKDVVSLRYEITVLYDDGRSGVVSVDQKPALKSGQRVRVVGNQIELLRR